MSTVRCPRCDTVFDDHGYENENPPHVYGHSECPNPQCTPERAKEHQAKLAARAAEAAQRAAEFDEFRAWKAAKAAPAGQAVPIG